MTIFKRNKKYDGTILHGLHNTASPAFKAKQNKKPTRNKKNCVKHSLGSTIHEGKPSANIPRHKIDDKIWNKCAIATIRSSNGL